MAKIVKGVLAAAVITTALGAAPSAFNPPAPSRIA